MLYLGGLILVLSLVTFCTGIFSSVAPLLIVVGLALLGLGVFAGEDKVQAKEGMKDGCGCLIGAGLIAAIVLWLVFR